MTLAWTEHHQPHAREMPPPLNRSGFQFGRPPNGPKHAQNMTALKFHTNCSSPQLCQHASVFLMNLVPLERWASHPKSSQTMRWGITVLAQSSRSTVARNRERERKRKTHVGSTAAKLAVLPVQAVGATCHDLSHLSKKDPSTKGLSASLLLRLLCCAALRCAGFASRGNYV